MYSRSYYSKDTESFALPQNYDGTAFSDKEISPQNDTRSPTNDENTAAKPDFDAVMANGCRRYENHRERGEGGIFSGILGPLFGRGGGKIFPGKIGTEEILILATAAFLFFSKEGDRECALLLLLLLLIN